MATFQSQQSKGLQQAALHQQRRRRSDDDFVRTGGFRKAVTLFNYSEPKFRREMSLLQKYSPCAANSSVDPYVVVTVRVCGRVRETASER